jgi:hypothetical protein
VAAPATAYLPASHAVQVAVVPPPLVEVEPAGQFAQVAAVPPRLYLPASHAAHVGASGAAAAAV